MHLSNFGGKTLEAISFMSVDTNRFKDILSITKSTYKLNGQLLRSKGGS